MDTLYPVKTKISVGLATCGRAAGADRVYEAISRLLAGRGLDWLLAKTGCLGFCAREPLVTVRLPGSPRFVYGPVTPDDVPRLLETCLTGRFTDELLLGRIEVDENLLLDAGISLVNSGFQEERGDGAPFFWEIPFYRNQVRVVLRNCGLIDPSSLPEYVARGGYRALALALDGMQPEAVIDLVLDAGLRGRGGAGFLTGRKWAAARSAPGTVKYLICNADEGDPGAYMDRSILEGDPFSVLEGMTIGAYAVGAREGYIYVRDEYPLAVATLDEAIRQAGAQGLLGDNILGTGFSFHVSLVRGAGAFVCGEETALLASLEGRMGEPRPRPPYPVESGLWGEPTCINNVETWANVPVIVCRGADWFRGLSRDAGASAGTKVFSVVGQVRHTGLVEVPLGTTLEEIVSGIAGGPPGTAQIKAVQTGGPSGGCIPAALLHLPVDFETLAEAGSIMGSGGFVVMDETTCMVDVARFFLEFTLDESCGKCTTCREGLLQMHHLLEKIAGGRGTEADLATLKELAWLVQEGSLCGLGKTAPNPVLSTLNHFCKEYLAHVREKRCPAGVCRGLLIYEIVQEECTGCQACLEACPAGAISAASDGYCLIDAGKCIKCGTCMDVCPAGAIRSR
ncbi:MAG: NADH-ubiquinone oxidoreductase-F iron-sulfur binding region domain-containing protein [Bacillota bacterium]|nr:NADH-ubiquinone oxidoreductase-F iron-sulfur binding region domain-containing protein [Bacillota bacterium]